MLREKIKAFVSAGVRNVGGLNLSYSGVYQLNKSKLY
jgi:hypothetical protein